VSVGLRKLGWGSLTGSVGLRKLEEWDLNW